MGLRLDWLGTHRLSWRDLLVIVRHSPLTSALNRELRGDAGVFTQTDYLLAGLINLGRGMQWQLGGDSRAPKPELFRLPGMDDPNQLPTLRGDLMSEEELRRRLGYDVEGR